MLRQQDFTIPTFTQLRFEFARAPESSFQKTKLPEGHKFEISIFANLSKNLDLIARHLSNHNELIDCEDEIAKIDVDIGVDDLLKECSKDSLPEFAYKTCALFVRGYLQINPKDIQKIDTYLANNFDTDGDSPNPYYKVFWNTFALITSQLASNQDNFSSAQLQYSRLAKEIFFVTEEFQSALAVEALVREMSRTMVAENSPQSEIGDTLTSNLENFRLSDRAANFISLLKEISGWLNNHGVSCDVLIDDLLETNRKYLPVKESTDVETFDSDLFAIQCELSNFVDESFDTRIIAKAFKFHFSDKPTERHLAAAQKLLVEYINSNSISEAVHFWHTALARLSIPEKVELFDSVVNALGSNEELIKRAGKIFKHLS